MEPKQWVATGALVVGLHVMVAAPLHKQAPHLPGAEKGIASAINPTTMFE